MGNENSMKRENVFWNRDVYADCPQLEDDKYLMKLISESDWQDLLKVYSDKDAVPFFNSDNCNGEDFYLTTEERMKEMIRMWRLSYEERGFVRWSIVDKQGGCVIGTIELFHRDAADYFTDCGLLRLDIRSCLLYTSSMVQSISAVIRAGFPSGISTETPAWDKTSCRLSAASVRMVNTSASFFSNGSVPASSRDNSSRASSRCVRRSSCLRI